MSGSKRIYYFDNLKFILIYLVVLGHFAEATYSGYHFLTALRYFIYAFHMPVFIFITGVFSKSSEYSLKKTALRSAEFLTWYVILQILTAAARLPITGGRIEFHLICESNIPWYMLAAAFWNMTVPLIRNASPSVILPASIVLSVLSGYINVPGDFLVWSRIVVFAPFFYAGFYTDREKLAGLGRLGGRVKTAAWLALAACFFVVYKLTWLIKPSAGLESGRNSYDACGLGAYGGLYRLGYMAAALVLGVLLMAAVGGKQNPFTPLGGRTLQIYVLHAVLFVPLNAYSPFLRGLIGDSLIRQLALIPIAFAVTLLLSGKRIKKLFDCVSDRFRVRAKKSGGQHANADG